MATRKTWMRVLCLLLALLLTACAEAGNTQEIPGTTGGGYTAPPMQTSVFDAQSAEGDNGIQIDTSHVSQGYVAASAVSTSRLKFQVLFGDIKYNYDLPSDGTPQCYVLQSGSGVYTFRVMQNTTEDKYAEVYSTTVSVQLENELVPFLRPSQMVDYTAESECVAKAAELATQASTESGVVANIYEYIQNNIVYDTQKAETVQSGYLPDPDETLRSGKGICYDYASLAAAMLRSQGIPTKLITGYVQPGDLYHAWNMIWLEETGWITVKIEAPAHSWERIDLTFAAGASAAYTGDGTGYTDRLTY